MVNLPDETNIDTPESNGLDTAARVGAGLKEVRERLGWNLPDVARNVRIRQEFLAAIEAGDLSSLPGTTYRVGFVRGYAQALGLDDEEILKRFRRAGQIGEVEQNKIKLLVPVPDRGVPKGAIIFIAFIVAVGGYGLWYYHTEQTRKTAQSVLQIPTKLQPLTAPPKVTPPPSISHAAPATPGKAITAPAPAASSAALPATPQTPPTAAPETETAVPSPTAPATPSPTSPPAAAATAPVRPQASAPPAAMGVVITAIQPSWIQVTAPNGTILFSKVLNAGQSWPVPHMPGLKMTTGNAGGTIISTNGKAGQPLGDNGVVLHNYPLTPAAQSSAAPTPPSNDAATAP